MRAAVLLALVGCAPGYDPTRVGTDPGTFGHRVVTLMCKRLAFQADPTDVSGDRYREPCRAGGMPPDAPAVLRALDAHRARLIRAIDHVVPEEVYDPLQAYLTSPDILALYDDDTMSRSIAALGDMLNEIGADADAMAAFERMGAREGYRHPAQSFGVAGAFTGSPAIRDVMTHVLPSIVAGGSSHAEWDALVTALGATFADASPLTEASSAAQIAGEFLLAEHPELGEATPLYAVRRDASGNAQLAGAGNSGFPPGDEDAPPTPFPTRGDTAARDEHGRAIDATGALVYDYFDVTKTLLGSMANDQPALIANGTAIDLVRAASMLLGDRTQATKTFDNGTTLAYRGYDTASSPLLDMAYAFAQLLRDPDILDTLALGDELVANHTPVAARLLEAAITAARMADAHPEAEIAAGAALWDDLRPHLAKITANPKLMRDLLAALKQPEVKQLVYRLRDQMKYKDRFDIAPDQTLTGSFATPVDRAAPDTGFNRSLWQRLLHLIADSNGAVECSKAGAQIRETTTGAVLHTFPEECELFRVDNMAVFYLQSIVYAKDANGQLLCETAAGAFGNTVPAATAEACVAMGRRARRKANYNYQWPATLRTLIAARGGDAYLEQRATIEGQRTFPTPEGLNRAIFLEPRPQPLQDTTEPPVDKYGDPVAVKHAGTLPVWEKDGFYDQMRPVLQAFADSNAEQIFVDIVTVLHEHWSSQTGNGVSYEPLVMQIFESDLWPALTDHAAELDAIVVNGKPFSTVVTNAGRFLLTPLPGLADRQGRTFTTTVDGKTVATLAPWHLIADAYRAKRARIAAAPGGALWPESTGELVDLLFRADNASGTWKFRSPHMVAATRATTKLLRDRIVEHDAAGDRAQWVAQVLPAKLESFFTHPLFAAAADFLDAQTAAGMPRAATDALLLSVFEPGTPAFATVRVAAADLVQLARDDAELVPLGRMAGALLAPGKPYLATQLALLDRMHRADTEATLTNIVARLFRSADEAADPGIPAISAIADAVGDVDRVQPGPPAAWTGDDYGSVFRSVGAFFHEEQRGMPRFVTIIKGRQP